MKGKQSRQRKEVNKMKFDFMGKSKREIKAMLEGHELYSSLYFENTHGIPLEWYITFEKGEVLKDKRKHFTLYFDKATRRVCKVF